MRKTIIALLTITSAHCVAQVIPTDRRTQWSNAGFFVVPPPVTQTLDITAFGGSGDGVTPNNAPINAAFAAAQGHMTVIDFPAGNFLFTASFTMPDSVIIRGAGAASTTLTFSLGGSDHCIKMIGGGLAQHYPLATGVARGTTSLTVPNTAGLNVGDAIRLYRTDSTLVTSVWARGSTGQMAHISAIIGPTEVVISSPVRDFYPFSGSPYFTKLAPTRFCGIECMRIVRTDATAGQWSNIWFYVAEDCWVRGVESDHCNFAHVELYTSANCEVSGCWFHHAFSYSSGGKGYGVMAYLGAGENLVQDNVFQHVRHAMLVEAGANGNVFAYNFSTDPYWNEGLFPTNAAGDIVLHGDYPYMNLYEGNIVQNMVVDNSHGRNGPLNTLFRNRADLWGLLMNNNAGDSTNIVGNAITGASGLYAITGNGDFLYGDLNQGVVTPVGTGDLIDQSCFTVAEPDYMQIIGPLPQNGVNSNAPGTNEAAQRFALGSDIATCDDFSTVVEVAANDRVLRIHPMPFSDRVTIDVPREWTTPMKVRIIDMNGSARSSEVIANGGAITMDRVDLPGGAYVIEAYDARGHVARTLAICAR